MEAKDVVIGAMVVRGPGVSKAGAYGTVVRVVGKYVAVECPPEVQAEHNIPVGEREWSVDAVQPYVPATPATSGEHTGKSVSYYQVDIKAPTTKGRAPYTAECNDIIEALGMNYAEGNAFKALWRKAAARTLGKAKAGNTALYDAEKVEFFGARLVAQES